MVTSQQSSIDLFRSLRTMISVNGLSSFKVLRFKDTCDKQSNQSTDNRRNRRYTDRQLDTVCPEN